MSKPVAIIELDTVESTMIEAASLLAAGALQPWAAVMAREQRAGRGRAGRGWIADRDAALLATVIGASQISAQQIGLLSIAAGIAVSQSVEEIGVSVGLKWPNDLLIDERKLGGILIQTQPGSPLSVLIGIGINLRSVPAGLTDQAVALAEVVPAGIAPIDLLRRIVPRLKLRFELLDRTDGASTVDDWTKRAVWIGEEIEIRTPESVSGVLTGIDNTGRLLIAGTGGVRAFSVGDIERGPRRTEPPYN